jgi:hypothetical protein
MILMNKDLDEIVYVDEADGLAFTRRDFPAVDYPAGTRVALAGVTSVEGVVVHVSQIDDMAPEDGGALEHAPVLWDGDPSGAKWQHTDNLRRL